MKVDVLAVLDRAANQARWIALEHQGSIGLANHWADITQARAAIADLLEKAKAVVDVECEHIHGADSDCRECQVVGELAIALDNAGNPVPNWNRGKYERSQP